MFKKYIHEIHPSSSIKGPYYSLISLFAFILNRKGNIFLTLYSTFLERVLERFTHTDTNALQRHLVIFTITLLLNPKQ